MVDILIYILGWWTYPSNGWYIDLFIRLMNVFLQWLIYWSIYYVDERIPPMVDILIYVLGWWTYSSNGWWFPVCMWRCLHKGPDHETGEEDAERGRVRSRFLPLIQVQNIQGYFSLKQSSFSALFSKI